ncbi:maleylpyruvate isomerase family mycothiol-dependent enzyme [Nocardioides campestrisoli]|uniref:maleylpyruvate isomerase family mycothiol-dependent enzyme n=1 Tax=Nocardioides campestrisoli TaxID=2736757 RepID=UPI0015E77889|nr:maleylpyruvate isomerase family mycothiol-dependent enzyme [Nocardioides campestrisoli]
MTEQQASQPSTSTGHPELVGYVDAWWQAIDDLTGLLEELPAEAWAAPTDLPGWDVHAVVAHTAHLESLLAGTAHDDVEVGELEHVRSPMQVFTEQGVAARRERDADDLLQEIRQSATSRRTALLEDPPSDPDAPAPGAFGALGWTQRTLLRNRPLDVWMHEQDVRRAVGRPGNLRSPAATHTIGYLSDSLGLVLAKRVGAAPGTTLVLTVDDLAPRSFEVGEDGRGRSLPEPPAEPTATIELDREAFTVLAGGRQAPHPAGVRVAGDQELAARVLAAMAVTP